MAWWEGGGEERRAYMCVCVYLGMRWCAELRTYIHTYFMYVLYVCRCARSRRWSVSASVSVAFRDAGFVQDADLV